MEVLAVTSVVPVADMDAAVERWTAILGTAPTFVDGDRWAQFDVAGARIALAGTDRATDQAAVMLKVADIEAARTDAIAAGMDVGPVNQGLHELTALAVSDDQQPIILYSRP